MRIIAVWPENLQCSIFDLQSKKAVRLYWPRRFVLLHVLFDLFFNVAAIANEFGANFRDFFRRID